jgi:hypothetical protein
MGVARFMPWKTIPGSHCAEDWMGPRDCLDAMEKKKISCPYQTLDPNFSVFQPTAKLLYLLLVKRLTKITTIIINNKKFCEALIAYFPLIRYGLHRKQKG